MYADFYMSKWSTSFEPSRAELVGFGIACVGVLMGISGIIFDQPILGVLGVITLLVMIVIGLRSSAAE